MNKLNSILERINNLIVILNEEGNASYVSPSVKHILGFDSRELMGSNWWLKTGLNDMEEMRGMVLKCISSNDNQIQFEREVRTSLGGVKWILWNAVLSEDGSIVGIGSDITDKKNTELDLERKNTELNCKTREIVESLEYAQRLQSTILPDIAVYKKAFSDAFVLFKPKDIVSGDFHWIFENDFYIVMAAVDCTGHGVPGAMMSIVGNTLLRTIVIKNNITDPAHILYAMDEELKMAMSQNGTIKAKDGMDMSVVTINKQKNTLLFSGAFSSMITIRLGVLTEYSGARYPIGYYNEIEKQFRNTELDLKKGDRFYLFSDGFPDQFGGERGKKFKKRPFKEELLSIQEMGLVEQQNYLEYILQNWKQGREQTDDILVLALEY